MLKRIILHVDMDAFFASVEERDDHKLKGKPIAVIGTGNRTVVTTSSYAARARGVRTGMNKFQAKAACPELIFVLANHEKYTKASQDIVRILYSFSPNLEVYSIDESFLDITGLEHLFGCPLEIGKKIKGRIYENLKLSCSIGIGPNKLLAKLASAKCKPDGLFWIKEEDVASILKDLPVEELWGIGSHTKDTLNKIGIYTCLQLASANSLLLRKRFGIMGECLKEMGKGVYDSLVEPFGYEPEVKSIGHSMTLEHDVYSLDEISKPILELADMVGRRMRREGFLGRTVTVTIRYNDFHTFSRQKKLGEATDDTRRLYLNALSIIKGLTLEKPIRLLGLSVSNLENRQEEFFLFEQDRRAKSLNKTLDLVNERFGSGALTFAALAEAKKSSKVSPAPVSRRQSFPSSRR